MDRQVLLDMLSEFLMVEQGGVQLYRVAAARTTDRQLRARYTAFGEETERHRTVLVQLIERFGGDPSYISPTARVAQFKGAKLLESGSCIAGLSQAEREIVDLENVLLAETKDHADWSLLAQLAAQVDDPAVQQALTEAVAEVESQEDAHLAWARETVRQRGLALLVTGPAPAPERWQQVIIAPAPPITAVHPAPMDERDGLLPVADQPAWQDSPIVCAVRGS